MYIKQKGFTLIELLVVISIIAMLLAILMPALSNVKAKAMEVYSTSNMRSLAVVWMLYAEDNDSKLVGGQAWNNAANVQPSDWVHPVIGTSHPLYEANMSDHDRELAGIRSGALWAYSQNEKLYHSPADRTWKATNRAYTTSMSPYRSYAISDAMNGMWRKEYSYSKINSIPRPSSKFVFIEEEDRNGANWGSWILGNPGANAWWDPISAWYGGKGTALGFADGHAEKHQWTEQSTMDMAKDQTMGQTPYSGETGKDIQFIIKAYHHSYY